MAEGRCCPECGSRDVRPDTEVTDIAGNAIDNPHKWVCNECGYDGYMPDEEEMSEDEDHPRDLPLLRRSTMHYRVFLAALFIFMFLIMISNIR